MKSFVDVKHVLAFNNVMNNSRLTRLYLKATTNNLIDLGSNSFKTYLMVFCFCFVLTYETNECDNSDARGHCLQELGLTTLILFGKFHRKLVNSYYFLNAHSWAESG